MSKPQDDFQGDNAALVRSIEALLALDSSGTLVPYGVGGHARTLLSAAAARIGEVQQDAKHIGTVRFSPDDSSYVIDWEREQPKAGTKLYAPPQDAARKHQGEAETECLGCISNWPLHDKNCAGASPSRECGERQGAALSQDECDRISATYSLRSDKRDPIAAITAALRLAYTHGVLAASTPTSSAPTAPAQGERPETIPSLLAASDMAAISNVLPFDLLQRVKTAIYRGEVALAIVRSTPKQAAPAQGEPFPYQKTFNAIAAATSVCAGHVEISVIKFREAFATGPQPSQPALSDVPRDAIAEQIHRARDALTEIERAFESQGAYRILAACAPKKEND